MYLNKKIVDFRIGVGRPESPAEKAGRLCRDEKLTITRIPEKATKVPVTFNGITKTSTVEFKRGKATRLDVEFDGAFVMPEAQPVIVPVNA